MTESENKDLTTEEVSSEPAAVVEKINLNEIKEELDNQKQEQLKEELKNFNDAFAAFVESFKSLTPEQAREIIAKIKNKK